MKRKYLAVILSLSMAFSVSSPVMASSDETQVIEEVSEDLLEEESFDDEAADTDFIEDDIDEVATTAEATDDFDTAQFPDIEEDFGDGSGSVVAVGDGETSEDGWTTLEKESSISFKYDESNKTLYFKCSGTAEMPSNNQSGSTAQWALALKNKTKEVEKVVIGEGITKIGQNNFDNTYSDWPNLKEVDLASTVTTIGNASFCDVAALQTINLNDVEKIEQGGLAGTGIEQAVFDKEQVEIGGSAFESCTNLKSVSVKDIINWGDASFSGCRSLTTFLCEKPIEELPRQTFKRCVALSTCAITGVKKVGASAFASCASLTSFDFSNVTILNGMAFQGAGLTKVAFTTKDLTLAYGVLDCENLVGICYPGTAEEWKNVSEDAEIADTIAVHCKADTVEAKAATCTEDGWKEVGVCEVCGEHYSYPTDENKLSATGHTWSEDYVVDKEATCTETGEKSKHCTVCDAKEDVQEIPALGHKWSNWKRTAAATVFKPEVQARKCSACNKSETRNVGKKLAPKATLNASTVTLKVKQSTSGLKVTRLAKGDSVKSWKSSNSKIFTVRGKSNGTCKITGKKRGTAKLQITLASGLKKTVKVRVQTAAVKTSKITVSKNVTVRKGKRVTLKPVVTPFTSRQKVTYTSSNKKIATVSSKGVVTGKKKGTVKITVKSGSKSVKVTVKVK